MTGIIHTLATKRTLDFVNLSTSGSVSLNLARAIDVSQTTAIQLVVRVHAHGIAGSNTIEVIAEQTSLTHEEPDVDFVGLPLSTVTLDSSIGTAPLVRVGTASGNPLGHMIRVRVKGTKPTSAATVWATLSVDLVLLDR